MNKKFIPFALFVFTAVYISFATDRDDGFWTASGWNYSIMTDASSGDYLYLWQGTNIRYYMYAKDVTPAKFALTAAILRDFFIKDDRSALHLWITVDAYGTGSHKMIHAWLAGKQLFLSSPVCRQA